MSSYDLLACNCQTFCNQLLKKMGKSEFPASTEVLDRGLDLLFEEIREYFPPEMKNNFPMLSCKPKLNSTEQKQSSCHAVSTAGTNASQPATKNKDLKISENIPSLSVSDLTWLNKALIPTECSWKRLGILYLV